MNSFTPRSLPLFLGFLATGCFGRSADTQPAAASASLPPASFVLFDTELTHRGDHQKYKNWNYETKIKTNPTAPLDWRQGGDRSLLKTGIYVFRVEVRRMERAWDSPMKLQFAWYNFPQDPFIRELCSPGMSLTQLTPPAPGAPWVYEMIGTIRALDGVCMYYEAGPNNGKQCTDWDWSRAFMPDAILTILNPRLNKLDTDGNGKISEAEFPDAELRATLTLYSPASPAYEFLAERIKGFTTPAVSFTATPAPR